MSLHDLFRGDIMPVSGVKMSIGRNRFDPPAPFVPVEEVIQNIAVFVDPASNTSGVIRFKGFVPSLELSLDGGRTFNTLSTLSSGIGGQVLFNNNNTISSDPGLTYNPTLGILGVSGSINFKEVSSVLGINTVPPGSGIIKFCAIDLANRGFMGSTGSGSPRPYMSQPHLFMRPVFWIVPNTTTSVVSHGDTVTSVGTLSHPAANVQSGVMTNFVTGTTAGNTGGTGANNTRFFRGGVSGVNTGFFFACRMTLPDVAYDGLRAFVGLTTQTMAASVASDTPAGDYCGFFFSTTNAAHGKNWRFATRDNTTLALQDTTVLCSGSLLYDMFVYSPPFPLNGAVYWTLIDRSNLKEVSGYQWANLPRVNQAMRPGFQISNVTATARNVRFSHLYCEPE